MDFRQKVEAALAPLVAELRAQLKSFPTLAVLNHYLIRSHAARLSKQDMPDGYWVKWRYLWALLLSLPFRDNDGSIDEPDFEVLDDLIEKIFDVYRVGAIFDPGETPRSEKEFLARLGLAMKVREPDVLAFPEQIKNWAVMRLEPFDTTYFVPTVGMRFAQIISWFDGLIEAVSTRTENAITKGIEVRKDVEHLRDKFVENPSTIESIREEGRSLRIGERLEENAAQIERAHIFTQDELQANVGTDIQRLTAILSIASGDVPEEYIYPHQDNPLEYKTLVSLPYQSFFFLDPANAYRIAAKVFEREIQKDDKLRNRYLKKRDKLTEETVTTWLKSVFPKAAIYRNYYTEKGTQEKDILVTEEQTVILVECKNSRVRGFAGGSDDLVKYESDFKASAQYAYEQALEAKQRILASEESVFYDEKKREYFRIRRDQVKRIFILCIAVTPRGMFGTDLSYELDKADNEPFPLVINLFDFETVCKHLGTPELFLKYLAAREAVHGRIRTGDELNYAGYFLKHGHLNFADGTFLDDSFSAIFDRKWYAEQGIKVEEPQNEPTLTSVVRHGNKVFIESSNGHKEVVNIPNHLTRHLPDSPQPMMKGADRNKPCPCGSGRKWKHCHGRGQG